MTDERLQQLSIQIAKLQHEKLLLEKTGLDEKERKIAKLQEAVLGSLATAKGAENNPPHFDDFTAWQRSIHRPVGMHLRELRPLMKSDDWRNWLKANDIPETKALSWISMEIDRLIGVETHAFVGGSSGGSMQRRGQLETERAYLAKEIEALTPRGEVYGHGPR